MKIQDAIKEQRKAILDFALSGHDHAVLSLRLDILITLVKTEAAERHTKQINDMIKGNDRG